MQCLIFPRFNSIVDICDVVSVHGSFNWPYANLILITMPDARIMN